LVVLVCLVLLPRQADGQPRGSGLSSESWRGALVGLHLWVGSNGLGPTDVFVLMRGRLAQSLYLAVNNEVKTPEQIGAEIALTRPT